MMTKFRSILRNATDARGCCDAFWHIFDIRETCENNLRAAVRAILAEGLPSLQEIELVSNTRRECEDNSDDTVYAATFMWIVMLNAHRCVYLDLRNPIPQEVVGLEYLCQLRAKNCAYLVAPTYDQLDIRRANILSSKKQARYTCFSR